MKIINYSILLLAVVMYACKSDSPNSADPPANNSYMKIFTKDSNNIRFEIWSTNSNLLYGYNDMGFKVFINNQQQTTGFVKFYPKRYNISGGTFQSSPVKEEFLYNTDKTIFKGYSVFLYPTDASNNWFGKFNYNNQNEFDSVSFTVSNSSVNKILSFTENGGSYNYFITLISPLYPKQGLNDFNCLLHRTTDNQNFEQVDAAQMYIFPWMPLMGHGSGSNVNPVYIGDGVYQGNVNFNMPGSWTVADSIFNDNHFITPVPSPRFNFDVQ
jgi:hypothetical protein